MHPPRAFTHPNALHKSDAPASPVLARQVTRAVSPHPRAVTTACFLEMFNPQRVPAVRDFNYVSSCEDVPRPPMSVNNGRCYWLQLNKASPDWWNPFKANET